MSIRFLNFNLALICVIVSGFLGVFSANSQTISSPSKNIETDTASLVDLDARVRFEFRSIGSDGVTRNTQYEELFMRRGRQVWMQRIRPKLAIEHVHANEKAGHKHLDPFAGGRLVDLIDGKVQLDLVIPDEKQVVNIPSVEFGTFGFDGSWERAYYLLSYQEFKQSKLLKKTQRKSEYSDAEWFEKKGSVNESILWDQKRMVPRVIESSNSQGTQWRRMTVTLQNTLAAVPPWKNPAVKNFDQLRYSDFMD